MQQIEPSASGVPHTRAAEMRQLFQWACMIVSSRSFCLIDNTGNKYACLAPMADFANHDAFCSTATFQLGTVPCSCASATTNTPSTLMHCPALVLQARDRMSQGDEVSINYGADKSNLLLLEAYGFAIPANLADRLPWSWTKQCRDFADVRDDLAKLDSTYIRVLESLGVHLGHIAAGMQSHCPPSTLCTNCCTSCT